MKRREGVFRVVATKETDKNSQLEESGSRPLLEILDLSVGYETGSGLVRAVDHVDLSLYAGESLGIVGESGSGKSTLVMSVLRLLPLDKTVVTGTVLFNGVDILRCSQQEMARIRWKEISIVFQKSMNSLSPVHKVCEQVEDIYRVHAPGASKEEIRERILQLFSVVNLSPRVLELYPHELSGGMLQRVCIALSLVHLPKLVIFDEATTALDVITQGQILDEVMRLERELKLTSIIVTHDISVVAKTCKRVAVMYAGRLMEVGDVGTVLVEPLHPYTKGLISSFPSLTGTRKKITGIPGALPDLKAPPPGCIFAPRCPEALKVCKEKSPVPTVVSRDGEEHLKDVKFGPGESAGFRNIQVPPIGAHVVACHKYGGDDA